MWYTKEDANANDCRSSAVSGVQHCFCREGSTAGGNMSVAYTHLRAHETKANLVCRFLIEKKYVWNLSVGLCGVSLSHVQDDKTEAYT